MSSVDQLIEHWRALDVSTPPFLHPLDRPILNGKTQFAFNVLPYPYMGDIRRANVWILMLNSGYKKDDDERDEVNPLSRRALVNNLLQKSEAVEYPFLSLNPKFQESGTFRYYNEWCGFGKLIQAYAEAGASSIDDARREIATRVAVLQLIPYRSTAMRFSDRLLELPSVNLVRQAVEHDAGTRLLVVPRSARKWGFEYGQEVPDRLVAYSFAHKRRPSFKPSSMGGRCRGGDAILERLLA